AIQLEIFRRNNFQIATKVEFTNIKCTSLDPKFLEFQYCYLKSINRSYKYISLKTKLANFPVPKPRVSMLLQPVKYFIIVPKSFQVNIELMKRFSGYKPFLYNVTVDACSFLKNPKSNPIALYLHGFFKNHSNMNHTCPYDVSMKSLVVLTRKIYLIYLQHDIEIDRLSISSLNRHLTEVLPFPIGDYLFQSNWIADGINRANVNMYFTLS
ncbi:hypothetical protein KR200_009225, partial [Drosophila serrata]